MLMIPSVQALYMVSAVFSEPSLRVCSLYLKVCSMGMVRASLALRCSAFSLSTFGLRLADSCFSGVLNTHMDCVLIRESKKRGLIFMSMGKVATIDLPI